MQEMQPNHKKSLTFWLFFLVIFGLMNFMIYNRFVKQQVTEVGYNVFMKMIDDKKVKESSITSSQIIFMDDQGNTYKTGLVEDSDLYERLYKSDATFGAEIVEPMNPLLYYGIMFGVQILLIFIHVSTLS